MILKPMQRQDFSVARDLRVDRENIGFTDDEMKLLAGPDPKAREGAKGLVDWWKQTWGPGREVPAVRQNPKSEFGYQTVPMLVNLIDVANAQDTPLDGVIRAQAKNYDFYILRCGVYIAPNAGETFEALKFEVKYNNDRAATYSMLPGPEAHKILQLGAKAEVGVDGKVAFGLPEVSLGKAKVEAAAKAELESKFIVSFDYELKTQVVDAFGIGNPFCRWLMHKGNTLRNDVAFYPILITPKPVKELSFTFKAFFKINHPDWDHAEFFENPATTVAVSA
jgi:hypothetical protein